MKQSMSQQQEPARVQAPSGGQPQETPVAATPVLSPQENSSLAPGSGDLTARFGEGMPPPLSGTER